MKILVMSDSHGWKTKMDRIIYDNQDADAIIFLGDGLSDLENVAYSFNLFAGKKVVSVRGNCDWDSHERVTVFENFGDYKFYITHGYEQFVKSGLGTMWQEMYRHKRNVGLFGHTHHQHTEKLEDKYFFNPGAVANGEYGLIFINEKSGDIEFKECIIE